MRALLAALLAPLALSGCALSLTPGQEPSILSEVTREERARLLVIKSAMDVQAYALLAQRQYEAGILSRERALAISAALTQAGEIVTLTEIAVAAGETNARSQLALVDNILFRIASELEAADAQ